MNNSIATRLLFAATCFGMFSSAGIAQPITNFTSWTLAADPFNALFSGSSTSTNATLTAGNGTIPAGTDIGFSSVSGTTVLGSVSGNYFSSASSFSLAIDYDLAATMPFGFGTSAIFLGFGIGEDSTGVDSAGITLGTVNFGASPVSSLAATARVDDATQPVGSVSGTAGLAGTFFVSYDEATGNVTVGAANTTNAVAPTGSYTFTGIANSWDGEDLLASFFMRSDIPSGAPEWTGTSASAVFSNFRVLEGTAVAIPEPTTATLVLIGGLVWMLRRRAARI
ncbi:MAG: PEP-CTERM sorting domain-containing protein [Terrimicrobiaceae bacterium]